MMILKEVNQAKFFITYNIIEADKYFSEPLCIITGYGIDLGGGPDRVNFSEIIIPSEIEGVPVKRLENHLNAPLRLGVFLDKNNSDEILEEEDIKEIKIERFVIPDSVTYIKREAFAGEKTMKEVVWPKGMPVTNILVFSYSDIESVIFPEGVTELNTDLFLGCKKLKQVSLPKSLKKIDFRVFYNCRELKRLDLPSGIEEISACALAGTAIEKIVWPENCPQVPSDCFAECKHLKEIVFKGRLESICFLELEANPFVDADAIETINMSDVITTVIVPKSFMKLTKEIKNFIPPLYGTLIERDAKDYVYNEETDEYEYTGN